MKSSSPSPGCKLVLCADEFRLATMLRSCWNGFRMFEGVRTRYGEPSGCCGAGTRSWTLAQKVRRNILDGMFPDRSKVNVLAILTVVVD